MNIVTITVNPALDKSSEVDRVIPERKLRCDIPRYEPGGGGINVSRAVRKLGGESLAVFLSGGASGEMIKQLLREEQVKYHGIQSKQPTRENLMIMEKSTGNQYRFGMPGPEIPEKEWRQCLERIRKLEIPPKYIVASGSLNPGIPDNFYARLSRVAKEIDAKLVVDTSGEALIQAAKEGVYMLKPNLNELAQLAGKKSITAMEQETIARQLIKKGVCQVLVVSLGARGAMLATAETIEYVVSPTVHVKSVIGAGDSMMAGMVLQLQQGTSLQDMLFYGVAAGTAATMTKGSELCRKEDTEEIYQWVKKRAFELSD